MRTVDSIVRGVDASALGTLAMDTFLYRRYRRGGGESAFLAWESSEGVQTWEAHRRRRSSPSDCSSA